MVPFSPVTQQRTSSIFWLQTTFSTYFFLLTFFSLSAKLFAVALNLSTDVFSASEIRKYDNIVNYRPFSVRLRLILGRSNMIHAVIQHTRRLKKERMMHWFFEDGDFWWDAWIRSVANYQQIKTFFFLLCITIQFVFGTCPLVGAGVLMSPSTACLGQSLQVISCIIWTSSTCLVF